MKTEVFDLSKKIVRKYNDSFSDRLKVEDVKEFIRLLKEELIECFDLKTTYPNDLKEFEEILTKLAGDKLKWLENMVIYWSQ